MASSPSASFLRLQEFVLHRMRMSHIYQPLMLLELLSRQGPTQVQDIARRILGEDTTQIDYYIERVKRMVGLVLTRNGIRRYEQGHYELVGGDELSGEERELLMSLCRERLDRFREQRGNEVFAHRSRAREAVSGSIKYRVLTRARRRCECCGALEEQRALEVDHIIPKNLGGSDDISNLQGLCFRCNAGKRDTDSTDFRGVVDSYRHREAECVFCQAEKSTRVVDQNELAFCIADAYPVSEGHILVIPRRHLADGLALHQPEWNSIVDLLQSQKKILENADTTITGFNVGLNSGASAGQTIFHAHWHLIPRREGDTEEARGGVRGVIPRKMNY